MGRPKRRFKTLERALRLLRNPTSPDTPVAPTAGSALENYQKWKKGDVVANYERTSESKPGSFIELSILLFSFPTTDGTAVCRASKRAYDASGTHGITNTDTGTATDLPDEIDYSGDFIPAQAVIVVKGAAAAAPAESKLTKIKYAKTSKQSYTLPFGKTTGSPTYLSQAQAIREKVETVATRSVTFYPEDLLDI